MKPVLAALDLRPKYARMHGCDASMPCNVELAIRLTGSYYRAIGALRAKRLPHE